MAVPRLARALVSITDLPRCEARPVRLAPAIVEMTDDVRALNDHHERVRTVNALRGLNARCWSELIDREAVKRVRRYQVGMQRETLEIP